MSHCPAVLVPANGGPLSVAVVTRQIRLEIGPRINGKSFDMDRVDIRAKLNTTGIWRIANTTGSGCGVER